MRATAWTGERASCSSRVMSRAALTCAADTLNLPAFPGAALLKGAGGADCWLLTDEFPSFSHLPEKAWGRARPRTLEFIMKD